MTIENFLSFWTSYNTSIIEALIALVIILSLFLAYRSFLKKEEEQVLAPSIDTAEIEKTLQRILENQGNRQMQETGSEEDLGVDLDLDEAPVSRTAPQDSAEAQKLRTALAEKQLKVQTLEEEVENLKAQLASAGSAASSEAPAAIGAPAPEDLAAKKALEDKVRDLEARLSEYEIISEDIADLTRYREENEKLKEQLANASSAPVAAAPTPAVSEAPDMGSVAVETASEEAPANIDDLIDQALAENSDNFSAEPEAVPDQVAADIAESTAAVPAEDDPANLIDDELMREFAAAVEDQKSGSLSKVAEKAGDGKEAAKADSDESAQLMNEFENFVNKKS